MDTFQALVEQYMPLANSLAFKKKKNLPRHIDVEELQSAAYLGLVEAASRYDESRGTTFSTFAFPRINGAINDHLRSLGQISLLSLETSYGDEEFTLKDTVAAKNASEVEETLEVLTNELGEQAQDVLRCYYVDEYSMKEVGERYGVSESRISQLITSYKTGIRQRWDETELREMLAA